MNEKRINVHIYQYHYIKNKKNKIIRYLSDGPIQSRKNQTKTQTGLCRVIWRANYSSIIHTPPQLITVLRELAVTVS